MTGRPGLAVVSFAETGGGLAYAARLMRYALQAWCHDDPWTAALEPATYGLVTTGERTRFAARVLGAELSGRVGWVLFNHVGVARVQSLLPRSIRRPYAVFLHDVEAWDPALSADRRRILTGARVRIANSAYTASRVAGAHPGVGPICACPLGLLDDKVEVGQAEPEAFDRIGPNSVLIVGRVHDTERYKGHDELLEGWPTVLAAIPDAQLIVAGAGNDMPRLEQKARDLGVGLSVVFLGFVPPTAMTALWRRVALFAMPSAREGFGLVYLEAMRAGRPCIGSTADAAGDVIVDGETGMLIDRERTESLASAIVGLLADAPRRHAMGDAGRRRYLAQFTAGHFAQRLKAILETPMGSC